MNSLETLATLLRKALAEDEKNKGGFNGSQYAAWCAYDDALAANANAYIAASEKGVDTKPSL